MVEVLKLRALALDWSFQKTCIQNHICDSASQSSAGAVVSVGATQHWD